MSADKEEVVIMLNAEEVFHLCRFMGKLTIDELTLQNAGPLASAHRKFLAAHKEIQERD